MYRKTAVHVHAANGNQICITELSIYPTRIHSPFNEGTLGGQGGGWSQMCTQVRIVWKLNVVEHNVHTFQVSSA